MSTFDNTILRNISTTNQTIQAGTTNGLVGIQLDIANVNGSSTSTISLYITESANNFYLLKSAVIPANNTLQVIKGQKIVLLTGQTLKIDVSSGTVDVVFSFLDSINA